MVVTNGELVVRALSGAELSFYEYSCLVALYYKVHLIKHPVEGVLLVV